MNDDRRAGLLEVLEPPGGGLARLRARIEDDRRRQQRSVRIRWAVAGSAALIVLLAVVPMSRSLRWEDPLATELQLARMRLGIERAPTEIVTIPVAERHRMVAQRVPLAGNRVILYRIGYIASE